MHDALRAYVHIGTGGHLSVLRHAQGIATLPVVGLRVVGNDHAVGYHDARCILMRGEESEGMAGIHDQCLLVGHLRKILHHQSVLCPILEDGTVAAIDYQLMGMLRHSRVEVVLNHEHDGSRLTRAVRVFINWTGLHLVLRTIPIHIYTPILPQLLGKFRCQGGMKMLWEVAQGITQRQLLLFRREDVLALGGVVDFSVILRHFGQGVGNAKSDFLLELFCSHRVNGTYRA